MTGQVVGVTKTDIDEAKRIDVNNYANWSVVAPSWLGATALIFETDPPYHSNRFRFLTFRAPGTGYRWLLSPVYPDSDSISTSHTYHRLTETVNGEVVPVICGPGGRPHDNLSSVLAAATKWTLYTSAVLSNRPAPFSK